MVAKQKKTRGPYKKRQTPVVQAKGFAPTRGRPMKVEVDLFMECEEESLSIAQIKAFKEAEAEHEKANNLIKLARGTGNTLVPSNSPNTFNIVPLKPLPLNPPGQVIASSYTHVSEAVTSGNQGIQILTSNQGPQNAVSVPVSPVEQPSRGLPPPRPAQFLNKQQPPANRALAPAPISPSPDIILVGETPPLVTNTSLGSPVSLATSMLNVTQFLTSHSILAKQGFKLVTVPSNQPIRNQWAIRPVLMSSQSQTMHSGTAMPVSIVTQPGARMPYTVPGTSMSHVRRVELDTSSGRNLTCKSAVSNNDGFYGPSFSTYEKSPNLKRKCYLRKKSMKKSLERLLNSKGGQRGVLAMKGSNLKDNHKQPVIPLGSLKLHDCNSKSVLCGSTNLFVKCATNQTKGQTKDDTTLGVCSDQKSVDDKELTHHALVSDKNADNKSNTSFCDMCIRRINILQDEALENKQEMNSTTERLLKASDCDVSSGYQNAVRHAIECVEKGTYFQDTKDVAKRLLDSSENCKCVSRRSAGMFDDCLQGEGIDEDSETILEVSDNAYEEGLEFVTDNGAEPVKCYGRFGSRRTVNNLSRKHSICSSDFEKCRKCQRSALSVYNTSQNSISQYCSCGRGSSNKKLVLEGMKGATVTAENSGSTLYQDRPRCLDLKETSQSRERKNKHDLNFLSQTLFKSLDDLEKSLNEMSVLKAQNCSLKNANNLSWYNHLTFAQRTVLINQCRSRGYARMSQLLGVPKTDLLKLSKLDCKEGQQRVQRHRGRLGKKQSQSGENSEQLLHDAGDQSNSCVDDIEKYKCMHSIPPIMSSRQTQMACGKVEKMTIGRNSLMKNVAGCIKRMSKLYNKPKLCSSSFNKQNGESFRDTGRKQLYKCLSKVKDKYQRNGDKNYKLNRKKVLRTVCSEYSWIFQDYFVAKQNINVYVVELKLPNPQPAYPDQVLKNAFVAVSNENKENMVEISQVAEILIEKSPETGSLLEETAIAESDANKEKVFKVTQAGTCSECSIEGNDEILACATNDISYEQVQSIQFLEKNIKDNLSIENPAVEGRGCCLLVKACVKKQQESSATLKMRETGMHDSGGMTHNLNSVPDMTGIKINQASMDYFRPRVLRFPDELKIKIVHLFKMCGHHWLKKLRISEKSKRRWAKLYEGQKLPSYDFTDADNILLAHHLVYVENKCTGMLTKRMNYNHDSLAIHKEESCSIMTSTNNEVFEYLALKELNNTNEAETEKGNAWYGNNADALTQKCRVLKDSNQTSSGLTSLPNNLKIFPEATDDMESEQQSLEAELLEDIEDVHDLEEIGAWKVDDENEMPNKCVNDEMNNEINVKIQELQGECNNSHDDNMENGEKLKHLANEVLLDIIDLTEVDSDNSEFEDKEESDDLSVDKIEIKHERIDEEFDRIEKGEKLIEKLSRQSNKTSNKFENKKNNGNSSYKSLPSNELGLGDKSTSNSQGINFQGSGRNSDSSQNSSGGGHNETGAGNSNDSAHSGSQGMPGFSDLQIVGFNDLQPGQNYYLMDEAFLNIVSKPEVQSSLFPSGQGSQVSLASCQGYYTFPSSIASQTVYLPSGQQLIQNVESNFPPPPLAQMAPFPTSQSSPRLNIGGTNLPAPPPIYRSSQVTPRYPNPSSIPVPEQSSPSLTSLLSPSIGPSTLCISPTKPLMTANHGTRPTQLNNQNALSTKLPVPVSSKASAAQSAVPVTVYIDAFSGKVLKVTEPQKKHIILAKNPKSAKTIVVRTNEADMSKGIVSTNTARPIHQATQVKDHDGTSASGFNRPVPVTLVQNYNMRTQPGSETQLSYSTLTSSEQRYVSLIPSTQNSQVKVLHSPDKVPLSQSSRSESSDAQQSDVPTILEVSGEMNRQLNVLMKRNQYSTKDLSSVDTAKNPAKDQFHFDDRNSGRISTSMMSRSLTLSGGIGDVSLNSQCRLLSSASDQALNCEEKVPTGDVDYRNTARDSLTNKSEKKEINSTSKLDSGKAKSESAKSHLARFLDLSGYVSDDKISKERALLNEYKKAKLSHRKMADVKPEADTLKSTKATNKSSERNRIDGSIQSVSERANIKVLTTQSDAVTNEPASNTGNRLFSLIRKMQSKMSGVFEEDKRDTLPEGAGLDSEQSMKDIDVIIRPQNRMSSLIDAVSNRIKANPGVSCGEKSKEGDTNNDKDHKENGGKIDTAFKTHSYDRSSVIGSDAITIKTVIPNTKLVSGIVGTTIQEGLQLQKQHNFSEDKANKVSKRKGETTVRKDTRDLKKTDILENNDDESAIYDFESTSSSFSTDAAETPVSMESSEKQDQAEETDLGAKLKSLMNADIFNVSDSDLDSNVDSIPSTDEEPEQVRIGFERNIDESSEESNKSYSGKKFENTETNVFSSRQNVNKYLPVSTILVKEVTCQRDMGEMKRPEIEPIRSNRSPLAKDQTIMHTSVELVKEELMSTQDSQKRKVLPNMTKGLLMKGLAQKRVQYPLSVKKKIAKLASIFSNTSLAAKYGLNVNTVSKWKNAYGHEEIAGLEFTGEELSIMKEINEDKIASSSGPLNRTSAGYHIYVDNPEAYESECVNTENRNRTTEKVNSAGDAQAQPILADLLGSPKNVPVSPQSKIRKPAILCRRSGISLHKTENQSKVPMYISLEEGTDNATKHQLRQKLIEELPNSTIANVEIANTEMMRMKKSISSVFGDVSPEKNALDNANNISYIPGMERTVYLCPIDNIFKYRFVSKSSTNKDNVINSQTTDHKTLSANKPVAVESTTEKSSKSKFNEPTEGFKMEVVKEARKSGFERTAKWFNVSMSDIMKWHDVYLQKKGDDLFSTEKKSAPVSPEQVGDANRFQHSKSIYSEDTSPKGKINVGLSFDKFQAKEGSIMKPRFGKQTNTPYPSVGALASTLSKQNRTRMGPNSTGLRRTNANLEKLEQYQAEVQGDLGIMPKIVKHSSGSNEEVVEIASTWKQVQSVLNPAKNTEKKYSQEFKNRIIKECESRGQKSVAFDFKIPYNEISRWRLESKKLSDVTVKHSLIHSKSEITVQDSNLVPQTKCIPKSASASAFEPSTEATSTGNAEQESLKIKIKLSAIPPYKPPEKSSKTQSAICDKNKTSSDFSKSMASNLEESVAVSESAQPIKPENEVENIAKGIEERKTSADLDDDAELRMKVVNYCFEQGVLKTQKKFNVTRQSIIDLMKEYDELNKFSVQAYNKEAEYSQLKTKLVSREKTSVEVVTTSQPIVVKNLTDYIVTAEYKDMVVNYAKNHGITAASRKFKRKNSTIKSWCNEVQRQETKKIQDEQIAKEIDLLAANISQEEARKISFFEARKKRIQLENEFRNQFKRNVVDYAKEFGITEATKKFKKKAQTIKSWMGHFSKLDRDAKKKEKEEGSAAPTSPACAQLATDNSIKELSVVIKPVQLSPRHVSTHGDNQPQKSPVSYKGRTPPQSPIWEQDFVIKSTSSDSPLKITFSPRSRSSPAIVLGSSTESNDEDYEEVDDSENDIETEDEEKGRQFVEFSAFGLNKTGANKSSSNTVAWDRQDVIIDLVGEEETDKHDNMQYETITQIVRNRKKDKAGNRSEQQDDIIITPEEIPNILEMDDFSNLIESDANKMLNKKQMINQKARQDATVIFSNDVASYLQTDEMSSLLESKTKYSFEENDLTLTENGHLKSVEVSGHAESVDVVDISEEEEEIVEMIPYEDTVMFKVFTEEIEKFFKDETITVKPRKKISVKSKGMGADAEIIANLEETLLFTGVRSTRNSYVRDKKIADDESNFSGLNKSNEDNKESEDSKSGLESKHEHNSTKEDANASNANLNEDFVLMSKTDQNDLQCIKNPSIQETRPQTCVFQLTENDKTCVLNENQINITVEESKSTPDLYVIQNETSILRKASDSLKVERSIFENLSIEDPPSFESKNESVKYKEVDNEKISLNKSDVSFGIFGKFMESFKLQEVLEQGNEKDKVSKVSNKIIDEDTKSESGESDIRERNERNLFDLIVPKDEPLEEIVESKSLFKPMKRSTRSTTRASTVSSENSESPRASKKKPMFKFPKIALNVNFGDIAKLGLTKLKQEGKIKSENDVKLEVKSNEKSAADWLTGDKILETFNIVTDDVVQAEADTKKMADTEKNEAQYTGVVMETFQQLRQRLMEDRIAQKAEKAKHMQDDNTVSGDSVAETITTEDHKEDIETGPESDDEMYKEFTPQKIVLILEISKKHGIAFASTSFGLPAHIIVNWIIEKDRKHRKVSISVSLEEKLTVVQRLANKEDIQAVANDHKVEKETIETWKNEVGWLLEKRGIQAVLEKWKKVETVSEMKLNEEFGKKIERQVSSNKQDTSKLEDAEISMCSDCTVDKGEKIKENPDEGDITAKESITPTNIETNNKDTEILKTLDDHAPIQNETSGLKTLTEKNKDKPEVDVRNDTSEVGKEEELSAPKVLLFARNTNPTFFTVEQKAMCVLLTEKYGINKVSKKLGISNGTLWRWMNRKTVISDLIEEHKAGYKKVKHIEETTSVTSESKNKEKKIVKGTYKQTFDIPEIAISTRSRTVAKENEVKSQRTKGYRSISPSKLPAVLQNIENLNSKDYSVEQKLAVLKLVELYGVRQIHKQFRLPTSCIWNWQNSKEVIDKLNDGKPVRKTFETASESVDDAEEDSEVELNIDVILDRTLVAVESVDYMNFKVSQKADVVYLIHHFGIEYVCEKLPQIPRGTLWNWRQSRHVLPIVDEITAAIKWAKERKRTGVVHMDRVVSHKVDKRDLTQKWLSECEVPAGGERKRKSTREGSIESAKRKKMEESEIRSEIADSERILRASSTSSVCSLISVHSDDDFEEILSDTEISSPSVRSKRSVASVPTSQGSMHSKKGNQSLVKGSSGKENSQKTGSVQETTNDSLTVKIQEPIYEVISIEPDRSDRLMVCYKVSTNAILSKPTEPGSKRALSDTTSSAQPPAKKKTVNPEKDEDFTHVEDKTGKLVPLEEFYYGTLEGDANFTEEKGEFRFKCWYCSKMLYNNVRAMQHIQGHITSSKQQNIDLSDLTQCKHCFKQFDTPFEMQTHVEKVHLSNKVLMCRICEQDFTTSRLLANHMRLSHFPSEMPYLCQLCSFRSSMYSDVVDHFKKKHDSSCNLLCLYCLRTFDVKFVSQGWGQTQTYYGHLLKHQSKTSNKKCPLCRLTFFNAQDVKNHRKSCHVMMNREASGFSPGGKQDTSARQKKSNLKSLNAPSVSKILDYGDVKFPTETQTAKCVECKMVMASADHYKKFIHCSMCRFATSCSVAYANHMLGFHSGQMSSLNLNIPWERPAQQALYCACGFSTRYGNKLANHLVFCTKAVCYTSKPDTMEDSDDTATAIKDAEKSSDSSVLGVLGLVQKRPEFMSRPGPKSKSRALQKTRPESRFANVINLTKEVLISKEKILNVIDITEDKTEDKDKPNMKMTDTNDVPNVGESKFKGDVDKEQIEDKKAVFAVDEAKNVIEGRDKKTEINEVKNEDNLKQEYKTENKTEFAEIQGIIKLIPAEENVTTDHDEEGQIKEMKLDLKEVIDLAEDDTDHQLVTENKTEDPKEARQAEQLINVTEKEEQTKKMKRDLKEVIDLAEDDTDHQLETENKTEDHKEARQAEQLINVTDKDGVDKEEDAVNETTEKMEVSIEESRKEVDNLNNEESVSLITVDDVAEESADDIVDEMAEDASMKESEAPDANVVAREPEPVIKEAAEKPEESQIEEISEMQTDEKIDVLESDEKTEEEVGKKSDQSEHLSLSEPIKVQSEVGDKESQSKEKSLSDSNKNNSDEHRDSRNSAERSHDRRSSEHGSGRRSEESRGSYDDRQRSRDSSERSRDRHNSNQDHRRSEERYRHDNRSHESNSSSSNDRDRSHERDRDYNRNRDYHQGDGRYGDSRHGDNRYGGGNRGGYSHGDNRDYHGNQGQRGQHGYQDNRGSYSRGGYNRGGHNPNYRGSYQGGYY